VKINNENEKLFKELASAYVDKEGQELRENDLQKALDISTDNLDKKLRSRLEWEKAKARRARIRNLTIAASTLAAGFLVFMIYTAILPTMLERNVAPAEVTDAPPPDGMLNMFAPGVEAEEDDGEFMHAEEGDEVVADADETVEIEDFGPDFVLLARADYFEISLPGGYSIIADSFMAINEHQYTFHILSANNQLITVMESMEPLTEVELTRFTPFMATRGIEILQGSTDGEQEYHLFFQVAAMSYSVIGEDIYELVAVIESLMDSLEIVEHPGETEESLDVNEGFLGDGEMFEDIYLPRGLFTIVPMLGR